MLKARSIYLLVIMICSVLLSCSSDDRGEEPDPDPDSDAKAIVTFSFAGLTPPIEGTINEQAKTIAVTVVKELTDVSALTPTIEVSEFATVSPTSGVEQDFTNPLTYTVTAQDGSTQGYVVTVTSVSVVTCLPSKLPAFLGMMRVPLYSDESLKVDYAEYISVNPGEDYTAFYGYDDDRLIWIEYQAYDEGGIEYKTYRNDFTYPEDDVIIESRYQYNYQGNDDPEAILIGGNKYYKTGDQITKMEQFDATGQVTAIILYYYNAAGNITHNAYQPPQGGAIVLMDSYEYDDGVNVYRLTGLTGTYNQFYRPELNMSRNNVTRIYSTEFDETFEYTYDKNKVPLTRFWEGGDAPEPYEYSCGD